MQKRNSFNNGNNGIPNDLNSVDLSNNSGHMNQQQQQQQTSQNGPGMMPWSNPMPGVGVGGMYDPSGYAQAPGFDAGQFGQHGMPRWDPKMNPAALAAQQYQMQQQHQQQQQQLTNAIRQKHAAQRPAPYATSRQMHQQQQQDMRHLGKPTKSSDALVGQPGYPATMMPSPVGAMGEHMMMANGGVGVGGQFPPNFRYMPPQQQQPGQAPYHPHHPAHLQPPMPFPGHQTMTKQPSGISLRASEASSTPPPPQAPLMPVPPRPQSSSVVESNLSGMSHSSSLQGLSEQQQQEAAGGGGGGAGGANPTPPITPKLNILTPNPQEPAPSMGSHDHLRLSAPVVAGELVPPFRIPPNNNYTAVQFQLSPEHHATMMTRHDLEICVRAFRVSPHFEPERLAEESRNAVCAFPPGLTVHVNQVFVRTLMLGEPLNQPIWLRKHVRVGNNYVQLQLNTTENILQYYFVVEFVHRPHIRAMIEQTLQNRTVPYAQAMMSLKSWIRQTPGAGLVLSLNDPINPERLIVLPARGRDVCQHPECFDLESFLVFNARTEQTRCRSDRWRCPICAKPLRDLEVDEFIRVVISDLIKLNPQYVIDKSMQINSPNYADEIVFDADARFRYRRSQQRPPPMYYHQAPAGALPPHYLQQQQQQQQHQAQIYQMMAANEAAKKHLSDASPNMKSPSGQPPPPSASPSFNPGAAPGPYYFNNNAMKPMGPVGGNVPMCGKPGMYPQQFMPGGQGGGYPAYPMDNSVPRPPSQPGLQPQYYNVNGNGNGNNAGQMKPMPNGMPMPNAGKQPPFHPMYSQQGAQYMAQPYSPAGGYPQAPPDQSQVSRPPSTSNPGAYAAQQQQQQSEPKPGGNFAGANQGLPNSNSHMEQLNYANSPISNPGTPASTLSSSASSNNMLGHLSSEQQALQYQQQQAFNQQQMIKNALNSQHQPLTPQSQAQSIYSNPSVSQPSTPSPTTPKHMNSAGAYDGNNQTLLQSQQQQQQQQQMSSGEKTSKSPASAGHVIDLTATEQTIQDANEATLATATTTAQEAVSKEQVGEATGEEDDEDGGESDNESTSSLENSTRSNNYEAAEGGAVSKPEEPEEKDILSEALMTSGVQDETGVGLLDNSVSAAPETTATAAGADETASSDTLNHSAVVGGGDQLPGLNPVDVESIIGGFQMDETYELLFQGLEPITDAEAKGLAPRGDFFPAFSNEELAAYLPGSDSSGGGGSGVQTDASAISNITEIQNGLLKSVVSLNTGYKELYAHVELSTTVQHHHHLHHQQQQQQQQQQQSSS